VTAGSIHAAPNLWSRLHTDVARDRGKACNTAGGTWLRQPVSVVPRTQSVADNSQRPGVRLQGLGEACIWQCRARAALVQRRTRVIFDPSRLMPAISPRCPNGTA
jgi:hypothetical protein